MNTLWMSLAQVSDLDIITAAIEDAARWLRTKGTDQWARPWPSYEGRRERLLEGLGAQKTWIVWDNANLAATITAEQAANPKLWNELEDAEPAVYVHRLVVSRAYASRGLGAALVGWAGRAAALAYGARWSRIDVWTTNTALHGYYERQGFRFVRFHDDPSYPSGALFQRPIARPAMSGVQFWHAGGPAGALSVCVDQSRPNFLTSGATPPSPAGVAPAARPRSYLPVLCPR